MKTYYPLIVLAIFVSIFGFIIFPNYSSDLLRPKVVKYFDNYRHWELEINEIFQPELMKNDENARKMNFDAFLKLSDELDSPSRGFVNLIKQPNGHYWIDTALSYLKNSIAEKNAKFFLEINIKNFIVIFMVVALALSILIFIYAISYKKLKPEYGTQKTLPKFVGIAGLTFSVVFLFFLVKALINYYLQPFDTYLFNFDFNKLFAYAFTIVAIQIAFVIFISIKSLTTFKNSDKFAFMWIVPLFIMLIGTFYLTKQIQNYHSAFETINFKYENVELATMQSYIINQIRYEVKTQNITDVRKINIDKFKMPHDTMYAHYSCSFKNNKIVVTATSLKKYKNRKLQISLIYEPSKDSLEVEKKEI